MFNGKIVINYRKILFAACLLAFDSVVFAQFTVISGEKSSTKWRQVTTSNYSVIYPEGLDSLGIRYAGLLEYYRPRVGYSAGYLPNQQYETSFPIVLHSFNATTNALVTLAPRRMEVFTFSDPYSLLPPVSWERLLSIHENRHIAQFQFAASGFWKGFPKVFGELAPLYIASLHLNSALAEGDAVVAETALTTSGRGRTADFLSYYRMAFDLGDTRNWYRWRYGSQKLYTPDYYRVGYMTVAGARYLYDAPMFMSEYLQKSSFPFRFNAMASTLRKFSGKRLDDTWSEIAGAFSSIWKNDDLLRGPFQNIEPVVWNDSKYYSVYDGSVMTSSGRLFSVRAALDKATELVEIQSDGSVSPIRPFNADSKLVYSPYTDCLYWSEAVPDVRWELYESSRIRMLKVGEKSISDFTSDGRYANPTVSVDGRLLAAADYSVTGITGIVLFSLENGEQLRSIQSLPGVQINEVAFLGDDIVFSGVSDDGMGLYMTDFRTIRQLEQPVPFKLHDIISHDGVIYFTSDKNGTQEIYSYQPDSGVMKQVTNTKYGVSDPFFYNGELCFSAMTPQGRILARAGEPFEKSVSYQDHASYPIADALTEQENSRTATTDRYVKFAPSDYSKAGNAINVHSWLPIYYNRNGVAGSMAGYSYEFASLGVTAFFQNLTSTLSGTAGISFHEDPFAVVESHETDDKGNPILTMKDYYGGLHLNLDYTGLFPAFNVKLDVGDRQSANTVLGIDYSNDSIYAASARSDKYAKPYIGGSVTMSVPLNFSSGGWQRSLLPFVGILASNDQLGEGYRQIKYNETWNWYVPDEPLVDGLHSYYRMVAGISGAIERPVASSAIYPRLGIGGGFQYSANPFTQSLFATMYGYLPGLSTTSGLKLASSMQLKKASANTTVADVWAFDMYDMAPRGFYMTNVESLLKLYYLNTYKFSVNYAIPVLPLDFSLRQYVYLRNMEFIPFADYLIAGNETVQDNLYSVGADIMFRFEKLLILNNTFKIGVRAAYNGGSLSDRVGMKEPYSFRLVAGVDF